MPIADNRIGLTPSTSSLPALPTHVCLYGKLMPRLHLLHGLARCHQHCHPSQRLNRHFAEHLHPTFQSSFWLLPTLHEHIIVECWAIYLVHTVYLLSRPKSTRIVQHFIQHYISDCSWPVISLFYFPFFTHQMRNSELAQANFSFFIPRTGRYHRCDPNGYFFFFSRMAQHPLHIFGIQFWFATPKEVTALLHTFSNTFFNGTCHFFSVK